MFEALLSEVVPYPPDFSEALSLFLADMPRLC
jgi:hypothetical protein